MSVCPSVIQYVCSDKVCGAQTGRPFMVEFPSEALLDEKNIATLFCPRCSKKLTPADPWLNQNHNESTA